MYKVLVMGGVFGLLLVVALVVLPRSSDEAATPSFTDREAGFDDEPTTNLNGPQDYRLGVGGWYSLEELVNWERPEGPLRVGVQIGHLDNENVPEELAGLTRNGAGATYGSYNERDTVAIIAREVTERLTAAGYEVDLLPATVPPKYYADVFISIHADGNPNTSVRGFKIAGPRRDYSGRSAALVNNLRTSYGAITALPEDPQITRRMSAYYAFNWARYEHAIHPFTPAAIVETGFLTNASDRDYLLNQPALLAEGIAAGVEAYLKTIPEPLAPPSALTAPDLPLQGTVTCAPVRTERRDRDDRPCQASLLTEDGSHYLLVAEPAIATSSLPYQATVAGSYMPVQMLENYFWFHYEVPGIVMVEEITREGE